MRTPGLMFFAALLSLPLAAQQGVPRQSAAPRVWSVSIALGVAGGGPAKDVEGAMRSGGFDDTSTCFFFCSGTIDHPFSSRAGGMTLVSVRRRLGEMAHVRAMTGTSDLGSTLGYKADAGTFGTYVTISQSVRMYSVLAGMNTSEGGVWAAVGPAFYQATLQLDNGRGGPDQQSTQIGAAVAGGFAYPTRSRIFGELQGQYHLVRPVDLDRTDIKSDTGGPSGTLPATKVNFNHSVALIGVGVRF